MVDGHHFSRQRAHAVHVDADGTASGQHSALDGSLDSSREHREPVNSPFDGVRRLHTAVEARAGCWCLSRLDREVLLNAGACAGASMADPLMSLVDTAFVGHLGLVPLAALGPNAALFNVFYFLFFTALAVLCTQAMAAANSRGDAERVGRGFLQALLASLCISLLLMLLLLLAPEAVLRVFQTNAEMMPDAKTYARIRALCLPAAMGMAVCQAAFRSLLDLRTPFLVVSTASAFNLLFDQLFMFTFKGGVAGCGWASVASQYIGAALFVAIVYRRRHAFGIPQALNGAAQRLPLSRVGDKSSPPPLSPTASAAPKQLLPAVLLPPTRFQHVAHKRASTPEASPPLPQALLSPKIPAGLTLQLSPSHDASPGAHHPTSPSAVDDDVHAPLLPASGLPSPAPGRQLSFWRKLLLLVVSFDHAGFCRRFAALAARGLLILTTYTSASMVASRAGTRMIAGHQVVQQQQQLQMSMTWSFLHVGQSMVANAFHSPSGAKAARLVANRIIFWAAAVSSSLATATWVLRATLPSLFVSDASVLHVVAGAMAPAIAMLSISWNNALEGCLLGVGDSSYVVKVYPLATAACLLVLGHTTAYLPPGDTLNGVWTALLSYYAVLLLGFAGRYWWYRGKI